MPQQEELSAEKFAKLRIKRSVIVTDGILSVYAGRGPEEDCDGVTAPLFSMPLTEDGQVLVSAAASEKEKKAAAALQADVDYLRQSHG